MRANHKRAKGFTLVELIVVIAIIGVLSAILVPSMIGYVNKAKFSSINASAKTLFNAGMTACRENDVNKPIAAGVYTDANISSGLNSDPTFTKYVYEYFGSAEKAYWAIYIRNDCPVGATIRKNQSDPYVGTYPKVNNQKKPGVSLEEAAVFAETGNWGGSVANGG